MTLSDQDRIEQLEAEVTYWKAEATRNTSVEVAGRIAKAFGMTAAESWILATLYAANGKVVRSVRLVEDLPCGNWEDRSSNVVQVFICRIRKKLDDPDCIETIRGLGYRLSAALANRIDQVLI